MSAIGRAICAHYDGDKVDVEAVYLLFRGKYSRNHVRTASYLLGL